MKRQHKPLTVLVIDDWAADAELFVDTLAGKLPWSLDEDISLVFAATAEGGLRVLLERPVDLVITEVRLSWMSGLELLQRVQRMSRRVPVVVLTRVDSVGMAAEAVRHGAFDYIVKPYDPLDVTRVSRLDPLIGDGRRLSIAGWFMTDRPRLR